jgi:hypothetical protein
MDEAEIKREREFLHDLLNQITKIQGRVKINLLKLKAEQPLSKEEQIEHLEKSLKTIDAMVTKVNEHRVEIIANDDFIPDPEINFDED